MFCLMLSLAWMASGLVWALEARGAEVNLSRGSTGQDVVDLQQTLNQLEYWCGDVDGVFGSQTYNAVVRFQKNVGIDSDGVVGPVTRKYLGMPASQSSSEISNNVSRGGRVVTMMATGYCPCSKCNWPYAGHPSYLGYPLKHGIIAVDPRVIPMGSSLYVEGYGTGIAADQGGAIKGSHIDLCFSTHQQALNWGVRTVKVTIY